MEITPACYPHLLSPLLTLADAKIAVVLEGGYCLQSLSEGAALTLKTLLGDPCPLLVEPVLPPCDSMVETILNCIHSHRSYWKCLQTNSTYDLEDLNNINPQPDMHKVVQMYKWTEPTPERFPTREWYPMQTDDIKQIVAERLTKLQICMLHRMQYYVFYNNSKFYFSYCINGTKCSCLLCVRCFNVGT